ncbi:MAG: PEP-CTERM sorting domain-containing protein [Phycisphaerae bacterium]|nr:PEP-CTERM sorting domain-containing protein [Phycisphaerae bacterium]
MKTILIIAVVLGFAGVALEAGAEAVQVICDGSESGGSGLRQYAYDVTGGLLLMSFTVGTNDLNSDNYTNILIPENWNFAIEQVGMAHAGGTKTPHGSVSPGPCWCLTEGRVRWWTEDTDYGVHSTIFGYDHPWGSEDVGWILVETVPPECVGHIEDWQSPVGTGFGPVHGPCGPLPGDANLDGMVDNVDLSALALNWLESPRAWAEGNFNGDVDSIVNNVDLTSLALNWQHGVLEPPGEAVPEPATLSLLLLGGLAMMIRKRK